jgi:hypothetical protein
MFLRALIERDAAFAGLLQPVVIQLRVIIEIGTSAPFADGSLLSRKRR